MLNSYRFLIKTMLSATHSPVEHYPVTGEELYRMPNLGSIDLVKGKLVQRLPAGYAHGIIVANLCHFLGRYLRKHKAGKGFSGQTGVYTERKGVSQFGGRFCPNGKR